MPLLTIKEVMERLGCSEDTVARLRKAGHLKDLKILGGRVRITSESVNAYVTSRLADANTGDLA